MKIFENATTATLVSMLLLACYNAAPAVAQGVPPGFIPPQYGSFAFVGRAMSMGPSCPPIQFHVVPTGKNQLRGIAFEERPPGATEMQAFDVSGTLDDGGKVKMDLKPLTGGSSIKVDGTFTAGMLMASMNGSSTCHSGSFMLMPVAQPTQSPVSDPK